MPSLQLHQLRVAAVGKLVSEAFKGPIRSHDVILACLFHDMGNIIKSDLTYFPEFVEPEGLEYWEKVKADFVSKYGQDHHAANKAIAEDSGLSDRVVHLVDNIGYSKLPKIVQSDDLEQKVAEYADTRVGPYGVLPLKERMLEGKRRFDAKRMHGATPYYQDSEFERLVNTAQQLEKQIFAHANIQPDDITDEAVAPLLEELQNYPVA